MLYAKLKRTLGANIHKLAMENEQARAINGSTICSFFNITDINLHGHNLIQKILSLPEAELKPIVECEVLLIDEYQKINAELISDINLILQEVKANSTVMGGVQLILFGDL